MRRSLRRWWCSKGNDGLPGRNAPALFLFLGKLSIWALKCSTQSEKWRKKRDFADQEGIYQHTC